MSDENDDWLKQLGVPANSFQSPGGAAKPKSAAVLLMEANRDKLEITRAEALVRMGRLSQLEGSSREAIEAVKTKLLEISHEYDKAYSNYEGVMKRAKEHAEDREVLVDVCVGIAIGVLVGVTIEAVPIMIAVEVTANAAAQGIKAAGKAAAKAVPKEAAGEGAEAALGKLAKKAGLSVVTDLQPGDMQPAILKSEVWKSLTKLHETAPKIGGHALTQGLLMSNSEYAIGEIKAHSGGQGDMSEDDAVELVLSVIKSGDGSKDVDKKLDAADKAIESLKAKAAIKNTYTAKEMERDIWVSWMGSLKEDCNILDNDVIEEYIGPKGLGLVKFGDDWSYTSDDEENEAIRDARKKKAEIEKRRKAAMSGNPT